MKTNKSKKSHSSSSSSSSSTSNSSDSDKSKSRSKSKSPSPSLVKSPSPSSSPTDKKKSKSSRRERSPPKDVKSKWDSPPLEADRKRQEKVIEKKRSPKEKSRSKSKSREKEPARGTRRSDRDRSPERNTNTHRHAENRERADRERDHTDHRRDYERNGRNARDFRDRQDRDRNRDYDRGHRQKNRSRSRSPRRSQNDRRRRRSRSRSFDHSKATWGKPEHQNKAPPEPPKEKEKPNFALSGKLTEETNTYRGVVIKYSEPPEARKPKRRWRLYPFKGEKAMQTLFIHRESAYLIGRDRKVVDLPVDHPSCSKQHAALQYRLVTFTRDDGSSGKRVRPYLIDLESANGTFINNKKIDPKKYIELLERDVIKFGFSSREYVLLHENSKDEAQDDDVDMNDLNDINEEAKNVTATATTAAAAADVGGDGSDV